MKLIREEINEAEYIVEEDNGKKSHKIKGIFMQANIKNRNGRVYPQEVLEKEVGRYNKEFVQRKRAFGELGHPDGPTVNLERVSHLITKLEGDNKGNYIGEAKITDTPYGKIVKSLIDEGAQLGVSSRGMGSVKESNGDTIVEDDFQLICFDFVSEPSTDGAFMMSEAKKINISENVITKADKINRALNDILRD